ncbi:MAG: DUF2723 domain-containing protein [Lentimicrobiaceae bacterium]|nr:DUF2723 domain-containing protein [Lentimicrobiaceae bacterium]MCB9023434.1 DUF2723 domain-containing protein [Lentimicrobiaceae bacterium]MCO5265380.1 DUF2723 domain-containing protein [Lentimicrobium sp.]
MKKFKQLNNIVGWFSFLVALVVYTLTLEPTASWWDCGEYISTAFKLQVGHPPGAPLFQMAGRFFSLFAFGNTQNVAWMINFMSGLVSAFTILFLFWTITHMARKLIVSDSEFSLGQTIAVLGSGLVGALAYTFSDSFWFSAVEGEVYAMSSFFTAVVFWAILKWEEQSDQKHSIRWIVFIAYLVGLSIGVHLLNLLAIPAIAFVYYYKRYKPSTKGVIITAVASVFLLAFIMYVIIPWIVDLAAKFELVFVNSFGLPFNSGTIFYFLFITVALVFGIIYTQKKGKLIANTAILAFTFILIGYSSFLMLVIRANANTPINENNPDDAISLLSYLNREQYGSWPIFYGQYYNAPLNPKDPYADASPIYIRDAASGKYVVTDSRERSIPNYDPAFCTLMPRMYSSQENHIKAYKSWAKIQGIPVQAVNNEGQSETLVKPTFGENLRFLFRYQLGHMYFRYFMWNFAGRQNDIQGHGGINNGNWLSGIGFLDEMRLGKQTDLPESMQSPARNTYYLLPLILGVIGLFFHFNRNYKDGVVVALLFFMTGIAIVLYLNQTPFQPRERDYAYAGSFYAFAIWIGLGVLAIYDFMTRKTKLNQPVAAGIVTVACLALVPSIMASENWDDHNRSNKYAARDFAANYLNSCDKNAVLITNGDNDTFPLWYAQEVEGLRTDVRVVNYMLASGDWYVHQLSRKIYDSEPLKFTLTPAQYNKGVNEYIPFVDRGGGQQYELKEIINFIADETDRSKVPLQNGDKINYFPARRVRLTVDSAKAVANGIVPAYMADSIVPAVEWEIKSNYLIKNDLMLLDFLASNNWERPLYFASPSSVSKVLGIDRYCHQTGIIYKFIPVPAQDYMPGLGGVDTEASYDILMNKCKWGNLNQPGVYVDPESLRNSMMPKQSYMRLAQALLNKGKKTEAIAVADHCLHEFPNNKITFDYYMLPMAEIYYEAGAMKKGNDFVKTIADIYLADLSYYSAVSPEFSNYYQDDQMQAYAVMSRIWQYAEKYGQKALLDELKSKMIIPEDLKDVFK